MIIVEIVSKKKHFCEASCRRAIEQMDCHEPWSCEEVMKLLSDNNVYVSERRKWDAVYLANKAKSDFLGSSLADAKAVAMWVKDVLYDEDANESDVYCGWVDKMIRHGIDYE